MGAKGPGSSAVPVGTGQQEKQESCRRWLVVSLKLTQDVSQLTLAVPSGILGTRHAGPFFLQSSDTWAVLFRVFTGAGVFLCDCLGLLLLTPVPVCG